MRTSFSKNAAKASPARKNFRLVMNDKNPPEKQKEDDNMACTNKWKELLDNFSRISVPEMRLLTISLIAVTLFPNCASSIRKIPTRV